MCGTAALLMVGQTMNAQDVEVAASVPATASRGVMADVLSRPVTVNLNSVSLKRAVKDIAASAGVRVQFRTEMLDAVTTPVTLHAERLPLGAAMAHVLRGTTMDVVVLKADLITIKSMTGSLAGVGTIQGTVSDAATKRAIAGATLTLDGTKLSVRTDNDGAYRFVNVSSGTYTLVVRRLGYAVLRQSITVSDNAVVPMDVVLSSATTPLQEVVTTVTGPQRRLELGNAIGVIKADSLMKEAPITSISQLLTARVPGLAVMQSQGTVGGNVNLQIRGMTSLTLTSNPIVIVDGIRYSSVAMFSGRVGETVSPLNDLNPNDVESVDIVKGPSAATLYGTDASNGVIVITTKRGKAGPARWTAFGTRMRNEVPRLRPFAKYNGWTSAYNGTPMQVRWCSLELVAAHLCTQDSVTVTSNAVEEEQFSVLQPDQSYGYGASVSGGQQSLRYLFSGNYENQVGGVGLSPSAIRQYEAQRGTRVPETMRRPNTQSLLNLRSNIATVVSPKLELNVNAGYTRGDTRTIEYSPSAYTTGANTGSYDSVYINDAALNVFARNSAEINDRFLVNANGQSQTTSWLTTRATIGLDLAIRTANELIPRDTTRWLEPDGTVREGRGRQLGLSADGGATAMLRRGRVSARTSVGMQYVRTLNDVLNNSGYGLPPGATTVDRANSRSVFKLYDETITLGTYVEETIGLNDRLFLTGAIRADGASTFGKSYSAVGYPKLSASWLVSEEPFIPKLPTLDEVRFRIAYGVSGRQPLFGSADPQYYPRELPAATGGAKPIQLTNLGNPLLRPERGGEVETGFDAGFFRRRLQLEMTWYHRKTADLLVNQLLPSGLYTQYVNAGLVKEHGVESRVTATLLDTRPLHWSVTFQHSSHYTKLVRAGHLAPSRSVEGRWVEGYPLGARFVTPIVGYADANHDGFLSVDEIQLGDTAVYAGLNAPPRLQTLTTTLGLFQQRLRFSALLDRQTGWTIPNEYLAECFWCRANFDPTAPLILQAYRALRFEQKPGLPITRYMGSGDFTRLREVSAAFTMPQRVTRALRASSSSVSLSVRNLALWSKFEGPDPESRRVTNGFSEQTPTGIPQSRTWVFRFDLGL